MNYSSLSKRLRRSALAVTIAAIAPAASIAQQYSVGDIVEDFTLVDRATGEEVSLQDMEGKVVFLEWFAWWCPFCRAAAADIETGIVEHYEAQEGNINGVPFMHVGINLQADEESQTQVFVDAFNIKLVLNDFDRALSDRFHTNGQPIFAIINGVANSPSHQQWELLFSRSGFGDLSAPVQTFRTAIDSVQAAEVASPPSISTQPQSQILAPGATLLLEVAAQGEGTLSYQWKKNGVDLAGANSASFELQDVASSDAGDYTVSVGNEAGSVDSLPASITIETSFQAAMREQGVPENLAGFLDDADGDGSANGLEYFSGTHANDAASFSRPEIGLETIAGETFLTFSFTYDPSVASLSNQISFSESPDFSNAFLAPMLLSQESVGGLLKATYRPASSIGDKAHFARLEVTQD